MSVPRFPPRVHMVGVAGGGLSGLAVLLADEGHKVSGSDRTPSDMLKALRTHGVVVHEEHDATWAQGADLIVHSAAVPDDNPELQAGRDAGIPVVKYSEAVGALLRGRPGIAIAGTHGKTTTTALLAHLLQASGLAPGWVVGGRPLTLPGSAHWGDPHAPFVVEACEYDDSFLHLPFQVGVVLCVAADHLDWFGDEAGVTAAFARFAGQVPPGGGLVLGGAVPEEVAQAAPAGTTTLRLGVDMALADIVEDAAGYSGRVVVDAGERSLGTFRCPLLGRHNLDNLLAALAAAALVGIDPALLLPHVETCSGVARRLQTLGSVDVDGGQAVIIDDFAHHPEEVEASAAAVRARYPGRRLVGVYQPHQVSRTESFLQGFADAFGRFDELLLCDIFVARDAHPERAEDTGARLAAAAGEASVHRVGPASDATAAVLTALRPDDVCLVMGAGDIDGLAGSLAHGVPCH